MSRPIEDYGLIGNLLSCALVSRDASIDWLPGYENSRPVRVGNEAAEQLQIDIYGELMDALHVARYYKLETSCESWRLQKVLLENLARIRHQPDEGIWEMRGPRRHFTHSKLMAWRAEIGMVMDGSGQITHSEN